MMNIRDAIKKEGLELPSPPQPVGNYSASIVSGNLLYISGQLPFDDGKMLYTGKLGATLSIEQGKRAAELAALNVLSQIDAALKDTPFRFSQIIRLDGFINATDSFTQHADVLNGASDLFAKVLGKQAGHIRTVHGCNSLPAGASVELAVTVELLIR